MTGVLEKELHEIVEIRGDDGARKRVSEAPAGCVVSGTSF